MWEDGQSGIFQFKSTASTAVRKTTELADSHKETPQLSTDLPEKVSSQALAKVVVQQSSRSVVNAIKVPTAASLLGMAGIDAGCESNEQEACDSASVRLGRRPLTAAVEDSSGQPQEAAAQDSSRVDDDAHSVFAGNNIWDRFGVQQQTQAAPKQTPKSKAKAKSGSRKALANISNTTSTAKAKRAGAKHDDDAGTDDVKPSRVESLEPVSTGDTSDSNKVCSMSKVMNEGDDKWTSETVAAVKATLRLVPCHDDEGFKADMIKASQQLTSHLQEIRARKRLVKRRTSENSQQALSVIDSLEDLLSDVIAFIKTLKQGSAAGDDMYKSITSFQENSVCQAKFGLAIITRAAKALLTDDMRWQRWEQMVSTTFCFAQKAGRLAPDTPPDSEEPYFLAGFLSQQMCSVLQKLLKGIATDAAS